VRERRCFVVVTDVDVGPDCGAADDVVRLCERSDSVAAAFDDEVEGARFVDFAGLRRRVGFDG